MSGGAVKLVRIDELATARVSQSEIAAVSCSPGERVRQLMREARAAANEQLGRLETAINVVRDLSLEVAQGGDVYGVGVRELAARLAEDLLWRGKSLEALKVRERTSQLAH